MIEPLTFVVTTLADEDDGTFDPTVGAGLSLREALKAQPQERKKISFASGLAGTIQLALGQLSMNAANFAIVGPGADVITIDGQNQTQIMSLESCNVSISGLTFARGSKLNSPRRAAAHSICSEVM